MKLGKVMLVAGAVLLLLCAQASGQGLKGKFGVTPQLGLVLPIGDFSSTEPDEGTEGWTAGFAKLGFAGGLGAEYFVTDNIGVGARFFYDRFGIDTDKLREELESEGVNLAGADLDAHWTSMEFGGYLKYVFTPDKPTRFFGRVGVLMGKLDGKAEASPQGIPVEEKWDVSFAPGLDLGVGVIHSVSDNMSIFGEAGFVHLMTDGKDIDVTVLGETETYETEINAQWFGVKAGVTFFLGGQ